MSSVSTGAEKTKKGPRWKICAAALVITGLLTLLFGFLLYVAIVPAVIKSQIIENSRLVEGNQMWNKWIDPQYKINFNVWVHSIKNPDQILDGELPEVGTTGPYVFRKKIENKVVSHENGTVTFKRFDYKFFDEEASCPTCILGNRAWVPNLIYQKFVEAASTSGMRAAATALLTQTAFLEVDVGELLFDGYKDPFLDKICEIPFMNFVCESILDVPERIGLLYGTNGTNDGVYEVSDGVEDSSTLAKVLKWNGEDHVDNSWWSDDEARKIRGTEGSLFPPFIQKDQRIYVFITQLCRSVYLVFKEEVMYRDIPAYRFVLPADVLDQSLDENKGYCNPTDKKFFASLQNDTECLPRGLLDISHCQQGQPPIVISMPAFHYAPDEVKNHIRGLNATNPETDEIYVDIEPQLGSVLYAQRVFQVNIEMWKGENLAFPVNLKKMRSSIVPVITVREIANIDEDTYNIIKHDLIDTSALAYGASKVIMILSLFFFVAAAALVMFKVLDISGLLAEAVRRIHHGESVSFLFNNIPKKPVTDENGDLV
ncbi:unnamed protein product, partial [Mesorhabditis spiculigera]